MFVSCLRAGLFSCAMVVCYSFVLLSGLCVFVLLIVDRAFEPIEGS